MAKKGLTIQNYHENYKKNKSRCGAKTKQLNEEEYGYVIDKVNKRWTPNVIVGINKTINESKNSIKNLK